METIAVINLFVMRACDPPLFYKLEKFTSTIINGFANSYFYLELTKFKFEDFTKVTVRSLMVRLAEQ